MRLRMGMTSVLILGLTVCAQAREYRVYFLGGQSNMDGHGRVVELPAELAAVQKDVWIFHGNPVPDGDMLGGFGTWTPLRPGHGAGFRFDEGRNLYSERFGAELSFALRMRELQPDKPIALIKYSRGGSSIAIPAAGKFGCWDPDFEERDGLNQYDHFLTTLRQAFAVRDIDGDGESDTLTPGAIIWMQGESDSNGGFDVAMGYRQNLRRLMDLIRAALRVDDLPVVIGRIADSGQDDDGRVWNLGEIIRQVQMDYVQTDCAAALVSTDGYQFSDRWHYDSEGYIDLGRRFAEAVYSLNHSRLNRLEAIRIQLPRRRIEPISVE